MRRTNFNQVELDHGSGYGCGDKNNGGGLSSQSGHGYGDGNSNITFMGDGRGYGDGGNRPLSTFAKVDTGTGHSNGTDEKTINYYERGITE